MSKRLEGTEKVSCSNPPKTVEVHLKPETESESGKQANQSKGDNFNMPDDLQSDMELTSMSTQPHTVFSMWLMQTVEPQTMDEALAC